MFPERNPAVATQNSKKREVFVWEPRRSSETNDLVDLLISTATRCAVVGKSSRHDRVAKALGFGKGCLTWPGWCR